MSVEKENGLGLPAIACGLLIKKLMTITNKIC
jgi:hypothetical protein